MMKKNILLLFLATVFIYSCSADNTDDNGEMDGETSELVGTWVLTDLRTDDTVNNDDLNFAKQIIAFLQGTNCNLVTFTFNGDGTLASDNKVNFLSINLGAGGLDVPCPTESDMESSTWSLDGDQLTIVNGDMEEETITIIIENNTTLIIPGENIDENNYAGADAVFTRQ